jgi:hypothetical protein
MSSGAYFVVGLAVGVLLTSLVFVGLRSRRPARPLPAPVGEVSAAAMVTVRELVAAGEIVPAVKLVREDTGWGLLHAKTFVDRVAGESPRT